MLCRSIIVDENYTASAGYFSIRFSHMIVEGLANERREGESKTRRFCWDKYFQVMIRQEV
jgi:hypothetical protein